MIVGRWFPIRDFTYVDVTAINKEVGRIEEAKVTSASEAPSRARKIICQGDVLYSCVRPYLLNIAIVETDISPPPIASTAFAVLNGFGSVLPRYQWIVLRSPFLVTCVEQKMRRASLSGNQRLRLRASSFSPSPPSPKQHRIVAKVDELMALCDRLEAAQAGRETTRDRLATASLAPPQCARSRPGCISETTPASPSTASARSPPAPTRSRPCARLSLNLAVRGKLVEQDPNDEPASELLKRRKIAVSRAGPFELPASWAWVNVAAVGHSAAWQDARQSQEQRNTAQIPS